LVGVLHQNRPFPGNATVRLQQLPRGVKMVEPAPEISAKDSQVVFHIAADGDALAGLYKGVICEVAFTDAGQPIRERSGSGILRVDAARTPGGADFSPRAPGARQATACRGQAEACPTGNGAAR